MQCGKGNREGQPDLPDCLDSSFRLARFLRFAGWSELLSCKRG
jgi:hypothetical protein